MCGHLLVTINFLGTYNLQHGPHQTLAIVNHWERQVSIQEVSTQSTWCRAQAETFSTRNRGIKTDSPLPEVYRSSDKKVAISTPRSRSRVDYVQSEGLPLPVYRTVGSTGGIRGIPGAHVRDGQ